MLLTVIIIVTAWLLNLMLPWWSIALPGIIMGYIFNKKAAASFGWGFLALFLLWGGQSAYIHVANEGLLSGRVAEMLSLNSPLLVILITALIGGLVSGLATMTGSLAHKEKSES